uniref:Uncharacterized protein n=1 Tax=Ananas comosus var. bracteatus TaxID=296719 RepID=A0A6V7Q6L2_ANACO|nr:unnamed protein product [Ananas comosus var. bracteatus]
MRGLTVNGGGDVGRGDGDRRGLLEMRVFCRDSSPHVHSTCQWCWLLWNSTSDGVRDNSRPRLDATEDGEAREEAERQSQTPPTSPRDDEDGADSLPSSAYDLHSHQQQEEADAGFKEDAGDEDEGEGEGDREEEEQWRVEGSPSKFHLYQISVQSPKGDISYLQKFFLMYVGGRFPLHLQEDFCGTALLSVEWLRSDPRRTAVGLDLDLEALNWCLENNPSRACLVKHKVEDLVNGVILDEKDDLSKFVDPAAPTNSTSATIVGAVLPNRDIVCAFNYSCCCLQKRRDLVLYFKHALEALSKNGGIFVMDLYGGTSSERKLRLQRRFSNFTVIYLEQAEFDVVHRRTRISLHFHLGRKKALRHAFSYDWRLWSLPEIKDCLEEAGFKSIHIWIRKMPNTQEVENTEEYNAGADIKYEEFSSFQQQDAWNAYIVGIANV